MSKQYIIKNCPAYFGQVCHDTTGHQLCHNRVDCPLKQIYEVCKESAKVSKSSSLGTAPLPVKEILRFIVMEEV